MNNEKLLNTQETMAKLRISRKTLYSLMARGIIAPVDDKPSYLTKRPKLQFRESDVEKLLNGESENSPESTPEDRVKVA